MIGIKPAAAVLLCASILVLCSTLTIDQGRVAARLSGASIPAPGLCLFKSLTGRDCPFCGLTRSLVSIGHLDLRNGWRYNRAGWLVYLLIAYGLVAGSVRALGGRRSGPRTPWRPLSPRASYVLSAILLAAWIIRLVES